MSIRVVPDSSRLGLLLRTEADAGSTIGVKVHCQFGSVLEWVAEDRMAMVRRCSVVDLRRIWAAGVVAAAVAFAVVDYAFRAVVRMSCAETWCRRLLEMRRQRQHRQMLRC